MFRVHRITLRFDNLLEGLPGPRKAVILMVGWFYSRRIQIKISKEVHCVESRSTRPVANCPPSTHTELNSSVIRDNTCKVSPTREIHTCLGVQVFIVVRVLCSHRHAVCVTDLGYCLLLFFLPCKRAN